MRKIYTAIDIGSDSVKVVVSEQFNDKFHVLASTSVKTSGVKKGLVVDKELVSNSLKCALEEIETIIGVRIDEAIVVVPSNGRTLSIVSGTSKINGDNGKIKGEDIINCLNETVIDAVPTNEELVTIIPITFSVDDKENVLNPKGIIGKYLSVKAVIATVPRQNVISILEVCRMCGLEAKDIIFGTIGDYYEARDKDTEGVVGAIVNIGSETIKISIFNKGIIIKDDVIPLGSKNIDKDISYVFGLDYISSKELKEKFSVCSRRYADNNDIIDIKISDEKSITINQYEVSEVVESRVVELLKLTKKHINDLTNRKISYIIVTGGVTELTGFSYVVENILGINASTLNITTPGIRNNKFSSAIGSIKYFCEKLKLKEINYSMLDDDKIDKMMNNKKNLLNVQSNTIVSNIFGYFGNN